MSYKQRIMANRNKVSSVAVVIPAWSALVKLGESEVRKLAHALGIQYTGRMPTLSAINAKR